MKIVNLIDAPKALPVVAQWFCDEWGHKVEGKTVDTIIESLKSKLNRDRIPLLLVAIEDEEPLGVGSLKLNEMTIYPDRPHWVGDIYVCPQSRGKGLGSAMTQELTRVAGTLGIEKLYLYTPDQENLYARLGWQTIERPEYEGNKVVVIKKVLGV